MSILRGCTATGGQDDLPHLVLPCPKGSCTGQQTVPPHPVESLSIGPLERIPIPLEISKPAHESLVIVGEMSEFVISIFIARKKRYCHPDTRHFRAIWATALQGTPPITKTQLPLHGFATAIDFLGVPLGFATDAPCRSAGSFTLSGNAPFTFLLQTPPPFSCTLRSF